jgi:hypothetical protein
VLQQFDERVPQGPERGVDRGKLGIVQEEWTTVLGPVGRRYMDIINMIATYPRIGSAGCAEVAT